MPDPNFGNPVDENGTSMASGEFISRSEVEALLAERDRKHAEELAAIQSKLPIAQVAAHGGGPGIDNHQQSWNLAEQEAAQRGELLDHWTITG